MVKIKDAYRVERYTVLVLDGATPKTAYSQYIINSKSYPIVPVYDLPKCIAIETKEDAKDFVNLTIDFK